MESNSETKVTSTRLRDPSGNPARKSVRETRERPNRYRLNDLLE